MSSVTLNNKTVTTNELNNVHAKCVLSPYDNLTAIIFEASTRSPLISLRKNDPRDEEGIDYTSVLLTLDDADKFAQGIKELVRVAHQKKVK